jgi:chemotaxis protein histidine kinase CheA
VGLPIGPEEIVKCGSPGFRGKAATDAMPGRGFGLFVTSIALQRLGGRLRVESKDDLTTVWLDLPTTP